MNTAVPLPPVFAAAGLHRFAFDFFRAHGMREEDARTVADTLLWADLRGVDTHGVSRLPLYASYIRRGDMDLQARPERVLDLPASAKIDAHHAPGPVAMALAVQVAMEKARAGGIGMALVADTTHTGALGCYTQALARQGFAGVAFAATLPFMVYHGAAAAAAGTNPLSIAVPSAGDPIVLDMATSASSMGQLMHARRTGATLGPGLAADEHGREVTDPQQAKYVLPLGGAKGAGLSLMLELLVSHLAANPIVADVLAQGPGSARHRQNAMVLAIDYGRFLAPALFAQLAQQLADTVHALPRANAAQAIRLPGERGDQTAAARAAQGIPLPAAVAAELQAAAQPLGLRLEDYLP